MIFKNGKFYNVYHDDAIIFNYLFEYKIIEKDNKTGFPETGLTKVLNKLDELKINYEIIYKDQNPITKKFSNLNQYHRILSKSLNYQDLKTRINRIIDIINNIDDIDIINDILNAIENVTTNKLKAPYFKRFILDLDPLLENIPRKDLYNRDTIRREVTDILYLIYLANNTKDSIIKYNSQIEILSRLAILDFYLERAYLYKYINQKQLFNFTTRLETIIKMTHGWIKSSNE